MKFSEILSVSGQPGLTKYLAKANNGIIVESLTDAKRYSVSSNTKVSTLIDIAIYTDGEDMPLADVFQVMHDKLEGKQSISHKSSTKELVNAFVGFVPSFDRDRVHTSDLKKVFQWYNLLQEAGMSDYNSELKEAENNEEEKSAE